MTYEVIAIEKDKHMPLLHKWFTGRNFPKPLSRFLPPTGFLCLFGGIPICAGFLYKTDADVAVISNLVSDPDANKEARSAGVDYLLAMMSMYARESGFGLVNVAASIPSLHKRFEKLGFIKTDDNVSHFSKLLEG